MLYYTDYRKFVDWRCQTRLVWGWHSVFRSDFSYVRWYRAVISDGLRRRILRRKLHLAEDTQLYGERVCKRWERREKWMHSLIIL